MTFSLRAWLGAGIFSFVVHASMAWSFTSPEVIHHVAKARGQQISVAGALSQFMSTPQTLKVEPEKVSSNVVKKIQPKKTTPTKPIKDKTLLKPVEPKQAKIVEKIALEKVMPGKRETLLKPEKQQRAELSTIMTKDIQPLKMDMVVNGLETPTQIVPEVTKSIQTDKNPAPVLQKKTVILKPAKAVKIKPAKRVRLQKTALLAPVKVVKIKPVTPAKKTPKIKLKKIELKKTETKAIPVKKKRKKKTARKKKKGANKTQRVASLAGRRGSKFRKNRKAVRAGDSGSSRRVSGRAAANDYLGRVQLRLRRRQRYPRRARSRRLKGTVRVRFTILRSGQVQGVRIYRSSGHSILDSEVLSMISRASPFPPFPAAMRRRAISMNVPIEFNLR